MVNVLVSTVRLLAAFVLVSLNGFFVAAEFAFVRIRPSSVDRLVEEDRTGSAALETAVQDLDDYLAVTQLGITISSLGLGWIGEPAVAALLEPVLTPLLPSTVLHIVAFALGFAFITFLHVVFGELAPKTIAIAQAERIALLVAPAMRVFYVLFIPGIVVFNGTANFFTRLIGIPPASEAEETLTEEEILTVLTRSGREGDIDMEEVEMIERVFTLDDTAVREVMVPRPDVVTVTSDLPLPDLRSVINDAGHTRYPVVDRDDADRVLGYLDVKDVLRVDDATNTDEEPVTAGDLAREIPAVPESAPVNQVLSQFQTEECQMAAVIDEWGAFEGIATVEDVVEEIVGDLRDEFDVDEREPSIARQGEGTYLVDGSVTISDVNDRLGADLESGDFGTIGGFVLDRLGRAPDVGDEISANGYQLIVDRVDGNRIDRLVVRDERSSTESTA